LSYYQKRAILPYVLFLVTAAMFVGRMEPNEEVLITYLEVIALFSSNFKNVNTFHPLFQKLSDRC
jgi:hypothetical protein